MPYFDEPVGQVKIQRMIENCQRYMYYTTVKMSYKRFIIQHAKFFFCFHNFNPKKIKNKKITSIQFVSCRLRENLSNQSSGVQISHDICTRFGRYLYSMKCSWIIRIVLILGNDDVT